MTVDKVFICSNSQAIFLLRGLGLPEGVHEVEICAKGDELVISPLRKSWHDFFVGDSRVSDDFLPERAPQQQDAPT